VVSERVSALVRLEIELALQELKRKASVFGVGVGLLVGAAVFVLFMLGFAFAALAAGLANVVPMWAALLIVSGILLVIASILGFFGVNSISKATPPVPEQAIEEARLTTEALTNGR
jgi:hypothetical protein